MLVLIVEDNSLLAFMIEDALIEAGHQVLGPVTTFSDAIELAARFRPKLAIVDIDLADGISGVDVARNLGTIQGIPSLFSTGQIDVARKNADVAIGVLTKPYAPDAIVRAVAALSRILAGQDASDLPPELEVFDAAHRGGASG